MYAHALKNGNPYHDPKSGRFTSKDRGGVVDASKDPVGRLMQIMDRASPKERRRIKDTLHATGQLPEEYRKAPEFVIQGRKDRLPKNVPEEKKRAMYEYMNGFHKSLKRENERAYAVDRSNQMINGEDRPSGMSSRYSMTKERAVQYERLIYKIFLAGRMKHHV